MVVSLGSSVVRAETLGCSSRFESVKVSEVVRQNVSGFEPVTAKKSVLEAGDKIVARRPKIIQIKV